MRKIIFAAFMMIAGHLHATDSVSALMGECWKGHDHRQMSECVVGRANEAKNKLSAIQLVVRKAINAINEDRHKAGFPQYKHNAKDAFDRGNDSFTRYRNEQCGYLATVAAAGHGAEDVRVACEASLDAERAGELEASLAWLN